MKIRHVVIIVIFVLVNIIILVTLNFGNLKPPEKTEETKEAFYPTLSALKIKNTEEQFNISGYGTVSSFNAVDLACEVQGQLTRGKHEIKPGVKFKRGDLLFKINDVDAQYSLRSRKSSFINIIANLLPDLKVDFPSEYSKWNDYIQKIKLNEPIPQLPAWSSDKEKIFLSTRNVLTEYFNIKSQEEQVRKYAVYAPFNGMVTEAFATNFSVVNPGTRIMRIIETDNFEIPVSIPAELIHSVEIGTSVSVYSTTDELKGIGTVIRVSEVINKSTQSVDVFVKPESKDGSRFIEGEYVRVAIDQTEVHAGVRIPKNAIYDNAVYVWSKADSTLSVKPVTVSDINENGAFVKGLKDNMIIITQEVLSYTDSSKYQILIQ